MLPGFRFLLAAILLSMSLLVFGLGAAALLRAAHEEFASNPSWRTAPEVKFAQPAEVTQPVLAMLHVDVPATEKAPDDAPAPASASPIAATKPPEPSSQAEAARVDTARPEVAAMETPVTRASAPASPEMPAAAEDAKIATSETPLPGAALVAAQPSQAGTQLAPATDIAATKIATLGGPPVDIETSPPAKVSEAKPHKARPDQAAIEKDVHAKRAARHRRVASARARLAAQQAQPQANPFAPAPPAPTVRVRRPRRVAASPSI